MEGINEMLGGTEILNKVTRENLTEWVAFELSPEGSEGASTLTGNSKCKGSVAGMSLVYIRCSKEACEYEENKGKRSRR